MPAVKKMSRTFILVVLWQLFLINAQPLTPEERQEIESYIEGVRTCKGFPGIQVTAVRNAETVLAEGYGNANIATGAPLLPETLLGIGSVTKHFTALLLSKLLSERSDVTWDTPVRDILGEELHFSTGYRTNHTCLRDLLTHKTGVSRNDYVWLLECFDDRQEIIKRLRFYEPVEDIRTSFIYNNLMFLLAGRVAEVLAGRSWEELIRQEFYIPIGMSGSSFVDFDGHNRQRYATPYQNSTDGELVVPFETLRVVRLAAPAGSISSNANDMGRWLRFLMTGQGALGQQVMDMDDIEVTWAMDGFGTFFTDDINPFLKPRIPVSFAQTNYGKGFGVGYYRGHRLVLHGGNFLGYHAYLAFLPDLDAGVYIVHNIGDTWQRPLMAMHVLDVLIGEETWLNVTYACNFELPNITASVLDTDVDTTHLQYPNEHSLPQQRGPMARDLDDYVGTYGHFGYGNVTVTKGGQQGNLTMLLGGQGYFELLPLEGDIFTVINVGVFPPLTPRVCEFVSSQGEGQPIDELHIPNLDIMMPPVFRRDLKMSDAPPPRLDTC